MLDVTGKIADELKLRREQVDGAIALLKEDATVPFIAHYRQDRTGGLDEAKLYAIRDRLKAHNEMEQRRALALKTVGEAGKLTPELQAKLEGATERVELEDLFMQYRSRRRTRSSAARQKGLEPLADLNWKQESAGTSVEELVKPFINPEKGVKDQAEALAGARDIVAERIAEDPPSRKIARDLLYAEGKVTAKAREGVDLAKGKFAGYATFAEPLEKIPAHRILAVMRGASEKQLQVVIEAPKEKILTELKAKLITNQDAPLKAELALSIEECFERLLGPALDNEVRQDLKHRADLEAIEVFARNLRALLLHPPFGAQPVLAIDPALKTGSKVVVLDGAGKPVENTVIQFDKGDEEKTKAAEAITRLIKDHGVKAIAIGNGTGSREVDLFIRDVLKNSAISGVPRVIVNESGASVYSASQLAREELPDLDTTARGTVSIGRRLQDPLAELVKIDPKLIGVGQYQHDVDQTLLQQKLEEVIEACVNQVGADINSASAAMLRYVAGIGPQFVKNVVDGRTAKGSFKSRQELKEIAGLDAKAYEQCCGFLRIRGAENPLDDSAIHPECYALVDALAKDAGVATKELLGNADAAGKLDVAKHKSEQHGELTLKSVVEALKVYGKDPRGPFVTPEFNEEVRDVADLKEGMALNGIVTNLTAFGAFVDVGAHQDGLVHISEITHKFIKDPSEALTVGQHVKVKVLSVDVARRRVSLSMKALQDAPPPRVRQPRKSGERPPRRTPPVMTGAPGAAPVEGATAAAGSPPRQGNRRFERRPRPQPVGAGAPGAPAGGPPSGPREGAASSGPRRGGDRRPGGGGSSSGPGGDRGPRRDRKPEPGKPDFSKFFVKKKPKERERRRENADGASREEVRDILRKQDAGGTSLADLLRKAGVKTDE